LGGPTADPAAGAVAEVAPAGGTPTRLTGVGVRPWMAVGVTFATAGFGGCTILGGLDAATDPACGFVMTGTGGFAAIGVGAVEVGVGVGLAAIMALTGLVPTTVARRRFA
jgi:hypothetical protein